ncbi:hypothetical protein [Nocardia sp. NPDC051832]|uniref:hypothetical protein n=1 Tax=Nocardia sp. NPDC051832 TaxID=3155673 RepID=UPI00343AFACC
MSTAEAELETTGTPPADAARPEPKKRKPRKRTAPAETDLPETVSMPTAAALAEPETAAAGDESSSTAPSVDPLNEFCADESAPNLSAGVTTDEVDQATALGDTDDAPAAATTLKDTQSSVDVDYEVASKPPTDEMGDARSSDSTPDDFAFAATEEIATQAAILEDASASAIDDPLNFSSDDLVSEFPADATTGEGNDASPHAAAMDEFAAEPTGPSEDAAASIAEPDGSGAADHAMDDPIADEGSLASSPEAIKSDDAGAGTDVDAAAKSAAVEPSSTPDAPFLEDATTNEAAVAHDVDGDRDEAADAISNEPGDQDAADEAVGVSDIADDSSSAMSTAVIADAEPTAGADLEPAANSVAAESSAAAAAPVSDRSGDVRRTDRTADGGWADDYERDTSASPDVEVAARRVVSPMRASAEPPAARARWDRRVPAGVGETVADAGIPVGALSVAADAEAGSDGAGAAETVATEVAAGIAALPLPAHRDVWEQRVLDDQHLLEDIAFAVGGPFHVMYPQRIARNIHGFREVFVDAGVDGAIYYGKKANKAGCVARVCAENGTGVDVSSAGELGAALAQGVRGSELMVTGPAKSDDLLWLAVRHGALIALDALDELERLGRIASAAAPARVLLRVLPSGSDSRFGLSGTEIGAAMSVIGAAGPVGLEPIQLEGFSFHLTGYDAVARAEHAEELIEHCLAARELGHPVTTISIGGGFGVDYVPEQAWNEFSDSVNRDWFHAGKNFDSFYPYHFPAPGPAMLSAILEHNGLGERLRDNDIRLAIEPGRALLDGAGSTVFRVQGGKPRQADGQPYQLLTVDGSSLSLSEQWFDSEFLPDPVLWPRRSGEPTPAAVGAATCLESDMLSWRRIPLPRRAEVGDLLVYPNTAGYQMDSNESAFHDLPIPPKVVLHDAPGDRFRWTLDS